MQNLLLDIGHHQCQLQWNVVTITNAQYLQAPTVAVHTTIQEIELLLAINI